MYETKKMRKGPSVKEGASREESERLTRALNASWAMTLNLNDESELDYEAIEQAKGHTGWSRQSSLRSRITWESFDPGFRPEVLIPAKKISRC